MPIRRRSAIALALAALLAAPPPAHAFTTRLHIVIANKVREALVDAGDGTIQLRLGDWSVILGAEDAKALTDHPLSFRAGAVGPDNMVFPGMTDPSHAIGQRPFEQCELLYQAAVVPEERAYALGCFLHGSTDAIAHHYVNYMTGETFTLTPITSDRQDSYDNVVRHILAESAIQQAALTLDPDAFAASKLLHTIPIGFVLRAYLDQDSPLWQMMSTHARVEYDKAVAANPGASLPTIVAAMDVAAADHLVMSPVYLASVDAMIDATRAQLEADVADMQDWNTPEGAQLKVTPGGDGMLGTKDDDTDCSFTCAELYATYFTKAGLLAPRYNAQNEELPSAFEKITDELRAELLTFHVAYLETVQNLSAKLNEPPNEMSGEFGVGKDEIKMLFGPLDAWADKITTIDYDTLVYAVVPDWIIELDTLLQSVGIDFDLAALFKAIFDPIVQPIKDAIQQAFIAQAEVFLTGLIDEIEAKKDVVYAEYDARLAAAAHPDLGGDMLDHFYDSGLYAHSFNIAAAALASHAVVLPVGDDPIGVGPASFDASHTPSWMQAGACDHLRPAIFPLGLDVKATMSVRDGNGDFPAQMAEDSPIECHDGSLSAFAGAPSLASCAVVKLAALLGDPVGSVSRAYPPNLSDKPASCEQTVVPGLPDPPPDDTTGGPDTTGGDDTGEPPPTTGDAPTTGDTPTTGATVGPATAGETAGDGRGDDGCGCRSDAPGSGALALLGLLALRRRRKTATGALALAAALGLSACGDDGGTGSGGETTGGPTTTSSTTAGLTTGTSTSTTDDPTTTSTSSTTSDDPTTSTISTTDDTTGGSQAGALLDALEGTVWHGEATRAGKTRGFELRFDTDSLLWSEVTNPFGPSRVREMRAFKVDADGASVHSTVIQPPGWEVHPENGRQDDWTLEVIDGAPRTLRATRDGAVEEFTEGAWPTPTDGLTATVRVFKVGGPVDMAFCDSGGSGFDYPTLLSFARGDSPDIVATDVVAGAHLWTWTDPSQNNQFSINDIDGFDQLGGTTLSDSYNFFVTYTGTITHPGGELAMREEDDSVEDAVWSFVGPKAGVGGENDLFLEVQGFVWPDATSDEPSAQFPAGDLPIEVIVVRCTEAITDVDVEIALGGGGWSLVGDAPSQPVINPQLFPPAL